jgi:glutamate 5-kinase
VAQILLTRNDIADRIQYLNAQNTLRELLAMGVIPIVNENDTLAVAEIKFGDNDTLSAITAGMIQADYLFLMTDVDCLYNKYPREFPDAQPIEVVQDIDSLEADVSSAGSNLGTGGMATKVVAARLATSAGTTTIITRSSKPNNVSEIISHLHPHAEALPLPTAKATLINGTTPSQVPPTPRHTRFLRSATPVRSRAFWILHGLAPHGTIYIDRGAATALSNKAGLLPVGIVGVEGHFAQQEAVRLITVDLSALPPAMGSLSPTEGLADSEVVATRNSSGRPLSLSASALAMLVAKGEEVGRAVVNYSSAEVARIKGLRSREIMDVLGYADSEYVALRENVSLYGVDKSRSQTPIRVQTPLGVRTPEGESAEEAQGKEVG